MINYHKFPLFIIAHISYPNFNELFSNTYAQLISFFSGDEVEARQKLKKAEDGEDCLTSDVDAGRKRKPPKRFITESGRNLPKHKKMCCSTYVCMAYHKNMKTYQMPQFL